MLYFGLFATEMRAIYEDSSGADGPVTGVGETLPTPYTMRLRQLPLWFAKRWLKYDGCWIAKRGDRCQPEREREGP